VDQIEKGVHGKIEFMAEVGDIDHIPAAGPQDAVDLCPHPTDEADVSRQVQVLVVFLPGVIGGVVKARAALPSGTWYISSAVWQ